jgi:hypothetical protein
VVAFLSAHPVEPLFRPVGLGSITGNTNSPFRFLAALNEVLFHPNINGFSSAVVDTIDKEQYVCLFVCLFGCLVVCLFVCLFGCLFVCLFVCFVCLFVY